MNDAWNQNNCEQSTTWPLPILQCYSEQSELVCAPAFHLVAAVRAIAPEKPRIA